MTKDNFMVGTFLLSGLESLPRGMVDICITFSIDVNGIINVTAEDLDNSDNKNILYVGIVSSITLDPFAVSQLAGVFWSDDQGDSWQAMDLPLTSNLTPLEFVSSAIDSPPASTADPPMAV